MSTTTMTPGLRTGSSSLYRGNFAQTMLASLWLQLR